ncbi:hypothetical protein ACSFVZ_18725 [Pseudoalteromonas sp. SYSU M81236]|uniref:hypothetical protein n=1 Tax=Pseudoalteromonas sp. SYSU M81236 TaxID=3447014 RepID=UPI003F0FD1D1
MADDILLGFKQRIENAKHGEKGKILAEAKERLGLSKDAFYRELAKLGYSSGRKARADKGQSSQDPESLDKLKAMLAVGSRKNGKQIVETPNAMSILAANGCEFKSPSTVRKLLREQNATAKMLNQSTAHVQLRSLYPNHVHQVDPSLCLIYYPPGGKKGRVQRFMSDDEFYKNKPENLEKIKNLRVWRYVLTDHYSGAVRVRYYESAGETMANLYDFLLWCWGLHNDEKCPMRGLPDILVMDKGSANTAGAVIRALDALSVDVIDHEVGRARAKGQVENANNLVEKLFESRLMFEPVNSVAELNERVIAWQNAYNADQIPNYSAKHSRHGKGRYEFWMKRMAHGKVRDLPSEDICRWLLTHKEETRTVKPDLSITFVHPTVKRSQKYALDGLVGIYKGLKVLVLPMALSERGEILVYCKYQGEQQIHTVAPIEVDDAGFDITGAVIGEQMKAPKDTAIDTARKQAERDAYPGMSDEQIAKAKRGKKAVPFGGALDAHSHLNELQTPDFMRVRGEQVDTGLQQPTNRLNGVALRKAIVAKRGTPITPEEKTYLADRSIEASQLPSLLDELATLDKPNHLNVVNFTR